MLNERHDAEKNLSFIDISELADGELQRMISEEWHKIVENMQDPERPYKGKRKLVITLTCTQNEKRNAMTVDADVKSTLVPLAGVEARFDTGRDSEGRPFAIEYQTLDARQIFFEDSHEEQNTKFFENIKDITEEE